MSSWNYRVLAFECDALPGKPKEIEYRICAVYYDDKNKANGYSPPQQVYSETIKGLKWQIDKIKETTNKPVLWSGKKFPEKFNKK